MNTYMDSRNHIHPLTLITQIQESQPIPAQCKTNPCKCPIEKVNLDFEFPKGFTICDLKEAMA